MNKSCKIISLNNLYLKILKIKKKMNKTERKMIQILNMKILSKNKKWIISMKKFYLKFLKKLNYDKMRNPDEYNLVYKIH